MTSKERLVRTRAIEDCCSIVCRFCLIMGNWPLVWKEGGPYHVDSEGNYELCEAENIRMALAPDPATAIRSDGGEESR